MDNLLNKVITVTSVESTDKKTVVKDQDGKKFNVWHTKKDGTPSKASLTMQQLQVKSGSTVEVHYTEEDFVLDGKNLKSKRVMSFSPTSGVPVGSEKRGGDSQFGGPGSIRGNDTFGEILGTQGIFQAMLASGEVDFTTPGFDEILYIKLAHRMTKEIRKTVNGATEIVPNGEAWNTEINVEDIPF